MFSWGLLHLLYTTFDLAAPGEIELHAATSRQICCGFMLSTIVYYLSHTVDIIYILPVS